MSRRAAQLAVPVGIVFIVVMLVVPLPPALLDVLIAFNISIAILVLMVAIFVHKPLDFSAFPAVLLVLTLFRLALNVSATRLVLLDGYAGKVIDTFGHFVVGGSLVVGMIVFVILLVIQFVVITNGAGRVAEVGARFTLDAMPGKQMAIDADLNSGLIDESEARRRRSEVHAEADFYGAMDGASKFVKGDAIAAIIITLVNLLGGFGVGVMQHKMEIGDAVSTYSLLSVGDGLVSQIPALLLSVATGLVVTRASSDDDMGSDIMHQLGRAKMPLQVAGFGALALCLIPGLPKLPFIAVGGVMLIASARVVPETDAARVEDEAHEALTATETPEAIAQSVQVDSLGLELAPDIIDLVDPSVGGDLLDRVKGLRRKIAGDLGVVAPLVRTRDNVDLPPGTYAITVLGVEAARGQAPRGTALAIGDGIDQLPGTATREPVFGLEAKWIPLASRAHAEVGGATVVDRASVITTHLSEIVTANASRLLDREDVRLLTDVVKRTHPIVVEELTPSQLSLGEVQRVLRGLLEENVPIRDLVRIFEAVSLQARDTKDPEVLVEAARTVLGPSVVARYLVEGALPVITFEPLLEQQMLEYLRPADGGTILALDPDLAQAILNDLADVSRRAEETGSVPVLVCAPQIRAAVRRLVAPVLGHLPVLSYRELKTGTNIRSVGLVRGAPREVAM